jgi:hypothetical protein
MHSLPEDAPSLRRPRRRASNLSQTRSFGAPSRLSISWCCMRKGPVSSGPSG